MDQHLVSGIGDQAPPSPRFRGGQTAADGALRAFNVRGYAARRGAVWPVEARGASGLSPWIRHGLLSLPRVWSSVTDGPPRDVEKFRSELLWQEFARHLYARVGTALARSLRFEVATHRPAEPTIAASEDMACIQRFREELHRDGWLPNPARMWLASHWSVRGGGGWRNGEDRFFQHLLDGSRAANRLGWQWTSGAQTGRVYPFERGQVERQAPGWCARCTRRARCPIEQAPVTASPAPARLPVAALGRVADEATGAGPVDVQGSRGSSKQDGSASQPGPGVVDAVWLTAESLGDADPALVAHPDRPAVFVFDMPRLEAWRLSRKRLVFLVECLSDLATRREVQLYVGDPVACLRGLGLAATWTPVPGWRRIARELDLEQVWPWPWLVPPHAGPIGSFSAWRKGVVLPPVTSPQGELPFVREH